MQIAPPMTVLGRRASGADCIRSPHRQPRAKETFARHGGSPPLLWPHPASRRSSLWLCDDAVSAPPIGRPVGRHVLVGRRTLPTAIDLFAGEIEVDVQRGDGRTARRLDKIPFDTTTTPTAMKWTPRSSTVASNGWTRVRRLAAAAEAASPAMAAFRVGRSE